MKLKIEFKWILAFSGFLVLLISCDKYDVNEQVDEGIVKDNIYKSHDIGWSIKIPIGWTVVSKNRLEELDETGRKVMESFVEESIDYSGLKHLISFSKNKFNLFQSTSEPFDVEYEGEWEETNSALKEVILAAYKNKGIRAEASEISSEKVGGLKFEKYEITIYSPTGDIILNQLMYSRLINGFDFGVTINSNNQKDKDIMLEAWIHSHFDAASGAL